MRIFFSVLVLSSALVLSTGCSSKFELSGDAGFITRANIQMSVTPEGDTAPALGKTAAVPDQPKADDIQRPFPSAA